MMRRSFLHISLFALLWAMLLSCERIDTIEAQQRQYAVVDAFLKAGEDISNINVNSLTIDGVTEGISDLAIHIRSDEGNYFLEESEFIPGNYFYQDRDQEFVSGVSYDLTFDYKGEIVSAETVIPPALEHLNLSSTTFRADVDEEYLWIDWTDINTGSTAEYFYLVKLTPLEEHDLLVSIDSRSPASDPHIPTRSGKVLLNPETTLSLDDFDYYGAHRVEVFAVSNDYKFLFEDQADVSSNGLTNITNGFGYFVGVSTLSQVIEVE